jgi:tetratricopeptide (TPR) repeat protein
VFRSRSIPVPLLRCFPPLAAMALWTLALAPLRADPSDDEERALKAANQSFKDGAFDLCNDRVAALLKKYPKSELAAQAEVLQAQALYQLGRSDAALAALNLAPDQVPENLRTDTLFWQAESLLDLGKWPDAEQRYRALLALKDPGDHADAANLGLAWALFKQGKEADAFPLIQALIKNKGGDAAGQQAQLLLAKIELAKKQFKEAIAALGALLATNPDKGVAFETEYWLGETYAANSQPDQAAQAYQKITGDPEAFPKPLVASAFLGLGQAQHALHQNDLAMLAYEQTYKLTENEGTQMDAFRAYLGCARASGQLPEAVAKLQEFAKSSDISAPGALFAIGSVLAEDREDDKAIGILESLLVAYSASPWAPAADNQLGELYARTGKPDQAIKALQGCIAANTDPDLVRTAHSQLGSVLLNQTKDFAGAAAQFALISAGADPAAENASYNFLLAQASLGKIDAFEKAKADFVKRFPKSGYLKSIALAEGQLLAVANKTDDAKVVYQKAIAAGGTGPDQEALLRHLADLQYQTNDLEGTLVTCDQIVAQFPNDALAAAQRGVLVSYELKKLSEDQVEAKLVELAQKYKNAPGAPEAYFSLGEFYFNHQDYVRAQDAFQQLTANFPTSADADAAYFYAGRAAFAHQDYAAARTLLEKVPDTSPLKSDARLWEGRVYQQQLNFDQANTLYDAALATEKIGPRFVEANLLKGQCLFALGAQDPGNYAKALDAFDQILKSKEGTIADRNEAAVRSAKCLEKLGRFDDALQRYLDVLYGRVAGDDATSPVPPEFSWQFKAGSEAGRIRESRKDWRGAIEIYKRLEQIGGAHAQNFHDLVNKLRRDNYIYE